MLEPTHNHAMNRAKDIFMQQSMLLELEAPIKICGACFFSS